MLPLAVFDTVTLSCINTTAEQFHIPAKLIISILNVERGKSGLKIRNKNGSCDLGEMQINTRWWPELYHYHITPNDVLYHSCTNIRVGGWILAKAIANGNNLLEGVGDYNSHTPSLNLQYTQKVREAYTRLNLGKPF